MRLTTRTRAWWMLRALRLAALSGFFSRGPTRSLLLGEMRLAARVGMGRADQYLSGGGSSPFDFRLRSRA